VARCVVGVLAVALLTACAGGPPQRPGAPADPSGPVEALPLPDTLVELPGGTAEALPDELVEQLALPPVTTEMVEAIDRLRAAAGASPDFGGPEISQDRSRIVVRWHGEVPRAVQDVVDEYAHGPFTVEVQPTRFRPGDLQAEAGRLVREHPGVVAGAGARPAGDGLDVLITEEAVDDAGGVVQALERHGVVSDFPLFAESGSIVPA
jgi:hypothetical protein